MAHVYACEAIATIKIMNVSITPKSCPAPGSPLPPGAPMLLPHHQVTTDIF